MSLSGNVINGTIVLDPPIALPDGTRVEVVVREPGRPHDEALARRFHELVRAWKEAKVFTSSGTEIALHPAYQQIIGMGKEALPLICSTIEGHTGWTVNEIMAFRIRGYAKAKARSDLIGQFTSIICCSMDKKAITDDDRVSRDLEVASALSLRVQVHVTAYLKTYYDAYKSIILAYPTIR